MTKEQMRELKTRLVSVLMVESLDAYQMGQQNCPGPISLSDADAVISDVFSQVFGTDSEG